MGSKTKLIHIDVFFEPGNLTIACLKRRSPFWELYVRTLRKEFLLSFVYVLLVPSLSVSLLLISSLSSPCRFPFSLSPPCFPLIGAPVVYCLLVLPWSVTFLSIFSSSSPYRFPVYVFPICPLLVGFHFSTFRVWFPLFEFWTHVFNVRLLFVARLSPPTAFPFRL